MLNILALSKTDIDGPEFEVGLGGVATGFGFGFDGIVGGGLNFCK